MDYYEGIVLEYLRADRSIFLNPQCCIQLNESSNPDMSGPHWYCDAVAADFRAKTVFLCEVTFSRPPAALIKRLKAWRQHWPMICGALARDCSLPEIWPVRPWIFIPEELVEAAVFKIRAICVEEQETSAMPLPRITTLEMVQPWRYRSWDRQGERDKTDLIPDDMK